MKDWLQMNETEESILQEAHSIGEDATIKLSFEEISERINYFLKEAPKQIQEAASNETLCAGKPFYPQILQLDL